jgi:hypothetical protein
MPEKTMGYIIVGASIIGSVLAFGIAYAISGFFIAPNQYRQKSPFAIWLLRCGIAGGAAFWTFLTLSTVLIGWFESK